MLKLFSEKILKRFIFIFTVLLAATPAIYYNETVYPFITTKVFVFRALVSLIVVAYLILILKNREYLPRKSNVLKWFLIFGVISLITGLLSPDPSQSFWSNIERFMGVFNLFHFFALALVLSSVFKIKKEWLSIAKFWNIILAVLNFVAFVVLIANYIIAKKSILSGRFAGFTGNPIFLASLCLVLFFLNLYLFFEEIEDGKKKGYLYILLGLMYLIYIPLTGSRGAVLALAITLFCLLINFIFNPNQNLNRVFKVNVQKLSKITLISFIVFIVLIFSFQNSKFIKQNYIFKRLVNFSAVENSALSRIIVAKIAFKCFLSRPVLGYGSDNFEICFSTHFDPLVARVLPKENRFDKAHNMPLEVLATTGIFGFMAFMAMYISSYKVLRNKIIDNQINQYSILSLILGLTAYFIQNLFVFDVFEGFLSLCLIFVIIINIENPEPFKWNFHFNSITKNILVVLILCLTSFNLYYFNWLPWKYSSIPVQIDKLIINKKVSKAIHEIEVLNKRHSPFVDQYYYQILDVMTRREKNLSKTELNDIYEAIMKGAKYFRQKYPHRPRVYLTELVFIASKPALDEKGLSVADIKLAREVYQDLKKNNISEPDIDYYFYWILLHSNNISDQKEGIDLISNAIKTYPEIGRLYWVLGEYFHNHNNPKVAGILIKRALNLDVYFETLKHFLTTVDILNNANDTTTAIDLINKYSSQNTYRFQLYIKLAESYIIRNDYINALKALNTAKDIYKNNYRASFGSLVEKDFKTLEEKINKLPH